MSFLLEIDKSKEVLRQTYIADGSKREDDAEHSFHLALMAYLLSEYADEKLNREHVMAMVLVHDLIEIDAGDTYAYDTEGYKTKHDREVKAADRIFNLLPEDQALDLRGLWDEFEEEKTPESRFANTLDHLQPILLTDADNGKSWREHGVCTSWIKKRNVDTGSNAPVLKKLAEDMIDKNVRNGNIKDE